MRKGDRYDVTGLAEAQFEPGSDHQVLRNKPGSKSGLLLFNFSQIAEEKKSGYFAAVQAGMEKEYRPMEEIFSDIIGQSLGDF